MYLSKEGLFILNDTFKVHLFTAQYVRQKRHAENFMDLLIRRDIGEVKQKN